MNRMRWCFAAGVGLGVVVAACARWDARAQERVEPRGASPSIQDALLRPCDLPFGREATLEVVAEHLHKVLRATVVLDPAALKRQELTPQSKVRLQLEGVRLKTGLNLLLEQAGLTYRVVPEDNLLILTDARGAEDPLERVFAELKELHRDIHDVQDRVDDLYRSAAPAEPEAELRKPTIIEEAPETKKREKARTRPG
jgi:hypothetical protein